MTKKAKENISDVRGLDTGRDKYIVTDLATDGEDYVTFSWELSRKVTAYKGIISFVVCAIKTNSDGTITNEWNTTLANGIVLEGLEGNATEQAWDVVVIRPTSRKINLIRFGAGVDREFSY